MRKTITIILLLVSTFCSLAGCSSNEGKNISIKYNNFASVQDSISYDVELIEQSLYEPYVIKYSKSLTQKFESLQNKEIFEIVRYSEDKYYTVSKLSDGSFFFMLFEETDTYEKPNTLVLADGFRAKKLIDRELFKDIQIGMSKNEVLELDPSAYDNESFSVHRFSNKSVITIKYQPDSNGNLIVSEIIDMDTQNSVLSYLMPQDFALISH